MNLSHSARRINQLSSALASKHYLEVGVEKGVTLFGVDVPLKVGVDPHFRFDPKQHESESLRLFQMTSDDFFVHHSPVEKFDIIFLDGLHTFEQTLRDFLNCLSFVHDRSIIVVDDVWPTDVYSSCRDHGDAIRFRKMSGVDSQSWHGDVYKLIPFVADFFPSLTYVTIMNGENAQTLIYKKARTCFSPRFNSLEKIERLSYFQLLDNQDLMNGASEADALRQVISALT